MNSIRLLLCLHNHQPVGNFDHVFENNYRLAYLPFIEAYEQFLDLRLSLHYSGPLWDWLLARHPEFIDRFREIVAQKNVELLGGAYYEPILSMIPESDRQGQIQKMREFLKDTFGVDTQGFWLTERVWEQEMTSTLADAGVRYTIVDDSHFINAGIPGDRLLGYYNTEDQGKLISVFGTDEKMRYLIPYNEPEDIKNYLAETAERFPGALVVYGDDGEKFGGWPGTNKRIYTEKWLEHFFTMLRENKEWIELVTPEQVLDQLKPLGKVYLPNSSYREMMEWALPVDAGHQYEHVVNVIKQQEIWNEASVFIRGGFWRNFNYKYPEINHMYARMMEVSGNLNKGNSKVSKEARVFLYKAQCNCPYWHGVFGGIYLNHLRFETYRNLIRADNLITNSGRKHGQVLFHEERDFDFDGSTEAVLQNRWHRLYFQPHSGGRIYEWDFYPAYANLLDTLSRRRETYHEIIREASSPEGSQDVESIHDISKLHDLSVKDYLTYDWFERKSFLDHILVGEISAVKLRKNECTEIGNLPLSDYNAQIQKSKNSLILTLSHTGKVEIDGVSFPLTTAKSLEMTRTSPALSCTYNIRHSGSEMMRCFFGMEWNFALLAGNAPDRYYFYEGQPNAGVLVTELERENITHFGLIDEWQRLKVTFQYSEPVFLYTFPIETVSQSETAYEKVYQSSVVYPVVALELEPDRERRISFTLTVDRLE